MSQLCGRFWISCSFAEDCDWEELKLPLGGPPWALLRGPAVLVLWYFTWDLCPDAGTGQQLSPDSLGCKWVLWVFPSSWTSGFRSREEGRVTFWPLRTERKPPHPLALRWYSMSLLRARMLLGFLRGVDNWMAPGMNGWQVFRGSEQEKIRIENGQSK